MSLFSKAEFYLFFNAEVQDGEFHKFFEELFGFLHSTSALENLLE